MSAAVAELTHVVRPAAAEPRGALVLLHGRGADEHDLRPLLDVIDPSARLVGITPRGPLALPPGGAHWYAIREIGYPDPQTFGATYSRVAGWLDRLPEATGVPLERTAIGGFSQGAVLSYALALGAGRPALAGLIALSGFMPTVEGFPLDFEGRGGFPVAIGHGSADPIIAVEWSRRARDRLEVAGADVLYHESPIGHWVDPGFGSRLAGWISDLL